MPRRAAVSARGKLAMRRPVVAFAAYLFAFALAFDGLPALRRHVHSAGRS